MDTHLAQTEALPWLLEPDPANPGVRYFALRELAGRPADDPEVRQAQREAMTTGPIPAILDAQHPEGYWVKPGAGYSPKAQYGFQGDQFLTLKTNKNSLVDPK